jgi:hypothetical protein
MFETMIFLMIAPALASVLYYWASYQHESMRYPVVENAGEIIGRRMPPSRALWMAAPEQITDSALRVIVAARALRIMANVEVLRRADQRRMAA